MRAPSLGGPRGPQHQNQGGIQRIDRRSRQVLWRMFRLVLGNYRLAVGTVLVCIVVSSVTSLLSTLFTRTLIDDYIAPLTQSPTPDFGPLAQVLLKLGAVLLVGVVCSYTYNRLMILVSQGTQLRLRKKLFEHMEQLPVSYFDSHSHGEIMSVYTNDVDSLRQMISTSMAQVFNSVITILVTLVSMLAMSVPLTLVSLFMALLMTYVTTKLGKRSRNFFRTQQQSLAEVNGYIEEMMSGQKVVKVFCHEEKAMADFERINEQLRQSACGANRIANIVMPVNGNLSNLGYVLIAVVGAALAIYDFQISGIHFTMTLGTVVAFLTLNKSFTQPISHVSQQINSVLNASVGAERVFSLMDAEPEEDQGNWVLEDGHWVNANQQQMTSGNQHPVLGDVDFQQVNFGYRADKQVLFDIDINTSPGQKIAFVGGTGAGKTTIINLISRFYDIQSGEIRYDDIPITDIRKESLRRSMSVVLQETRLFSGTVLDNIRYGRLDATDEECIAAARLVGADDFIRRLGNGYYTHLDAEGGNLSQGECQLLAIVRAAVANPPVLVLDEATSSVDTHTELLVQRGMDSIMRGRTTFVIAHRLSTVRNADQIIVMEHGRISEHGTHDELMAIRGSYYRLYTGNDIN